MSRDLYVFDLDYTLIDADSSTLWCRYMVENHIAEDPDFLNKEKRLMDAYDRGELNVHDYIAFSMPPSHVTGRARRKTVRQLAKMITSAIFVNFFT